MYMTVLKANIESLSKRDYFVDLHDGNLVHQWLTAQLQNNRKDENILFKVEEKEDYVFLYIQSDSKFPLNDIERAGFMFHKAYEIKADENNLVWFNVFCSTEITRCNCNKKTFVTDKNERLKIIKRRLGDCIDIEDVQEVKTKKIYFSRTNKKTNTKKMVSVPGTEFEGCGKIKNIDLFNQKVNSGIGRCKTFGMGLVFFKTF